jgi:putative transport protein
VKLNALAAAIVILGAAAARRGSAGSLISTGVRYLGRRPGKYARAWRRNSGAWDYAGLPARSCALAALSCAFTFAAAIVGSIGTLLLIKRIFQISPALEAARIGAANCSAEPLERRTLVVTNPNLDGLRLDGISGRVEAGVTISRVRHANEIYTASSAMVVRGGDRMAVVGTRAGLDEFQPSSDSRVTRISSAAPRAASASAACL